MNLDNAAIAAREKLAIELAQQAGEIALRHFRQPDLAVSNKGLQDFVTVADHAVEQFLVERLAEAFPEDAVLGEEGGLRGNEDAGRPCWVIDPIDGTDNYRRGLAMWCISIGLLIDREPVMGVIHCPVLGELFSARQSAGAFCNGKAITVSKETEPTRSRINLGYSRKRVPPATHAAQVERLLQAGCEYSRLGSAAIGLASVASGRYEGFWEAHINAWDVAAGICIVREAGGWANDFFAGEGFSQGNAILACPPGLKPFLTDCFADGLNSSADQG